MLYRIFYWLLRKFSWLYRCANWRYREFFAAENIKDIKKFRAKKSDLTFRCNVKVPHLACKVWVRSLFSLLCESEKSKNCFWIISWYVLSMSTNTLLTPCKARCGTFTLLPSLLPARCEYGVCSHWNSSRRQCTARCSQRVAQRFSDVCTLWSSYQWANISAEPHEQRAVHCFFYENKHLTHTKQGAYFHVTRIPNSQLYRSSFSARKPAKIQRAIHYLP